MGGPGGGRQAVGGADRNVRRGGGGEGGDRNIRIIDADSSFGGARRGGRTQS